MAADEYEGALRDEATRTWFAQRFVRLKALAVFCGIVIFVAPVVLYGADFESGPAMWVLYVVEPIAFAGGVYYSYREPRLKQGRQILSVYPWQRLEGAARVASDGRPVFELPVPEGEPGTTVSLRVGFPDVRRWRRLLDQEPGREILFAGDPRLGGVVALPGPQGLTSTKAAKSGPTKSALAEFIEERYGEAPEVNDAISEAALARARAAGLGPTQRQPEFD